MRRTFFVVVGKGMVDFVWWGLRGEAGFWGVGLYTRAAIGLLTRVYTYTYCGK